MRRLLALLLVLVTVSLCAPDAHARHRHRRHRSEGERHHVRRRNTLLGVGVVGVATHSGVLKGVGFGGAVANEVIDRRHRDW